MDDRIIIFQAIILSAVIFGPVIWLESLLKKRTKKQEEMEDLIQ